MNWNTTLKSFLGYRATIELRLSKFTQSFSLLTPPPGLASTRWSYVIWDFLLLEGWKTTKHHIFVVGLQCFVGQNQSFFFIGTSSILLGWDQSQTNCTTITFFNWSGHPTKLPPWDKGSVRQEKIERNFLCLQRRVLDGVCHQGGCVPDSLFLQKLSSLNKICPHLL